MCVRACVFARACVCNVCACVCVCVCNVVCVCDVVCACVHSVCVFNNTLHPPLVKQDKRVIIIPPSLLQNHFGGDCVYHMYPVYNTLQFQPLPAPLQRRSGDKQASLVERMFTALRLGRKKRTFSHTHPVRSKMR